MLFTRAFKDIVIDCKQQFPNGNSNLGLICQSICGVHDKTSIYVLGFHCNFLSQQRLVI